MLFADRGSLFISIDKFRQNLTWRIPMKIASILAGVAIAALSASAASAQAVNVIHKGQHQGTPGFFGPVYNPNVTTDVTGAVSGAFNLARAFNGGTNISAWHAVGAARVVVEATSLTIKIRFYVNKAIAHVLSDRLMRISWKIYFWPTS